ncbi:cell division protein DivIC [Bacillus ectoiniformans]|uniref:FtsB family cell division protein n=1 Tax=Bacillus ectoiniformans TaxID=1494429 RepID=UPI0019564AB2|nr:septum formation initiator family protein [Bacillus ectoiniformans]MBM7650292.1 cell division protein DivIC [Bacillus ectoiniformans]
MSESSKRKVTALKNAFIFSQEKKEKFLAKHKTKLFRRLSAFAVVAMLIMAGMVSTLVSQSARLDEKIEQKERAEAALDELKTNEVKYEEELERLKHDEYIAELARKKYFLSDQGEIIFNIPENAEKDRKNEQ